MKVRQAAPGSALFFLVGPGSVVVLIPWLLSRWRFDGPPPSGLDWLMIIGRAAGVVLTLAGGAFLVHAFVRFVVEGFGTPVPAAPPTRLVVGGAYRHVRNPMYVAIFAAVGGQALLFWSFPVLVYLAIAIMVVVCWVRIFEEPQLRRRFGDDYVRYCGNVPGWLPRLRPWRPAFGT
ncbi:methyltransferase family protein [Microlunatus sp. GCM10028923]|uniref:methyltransferase family protein n=1 Tax=Microlunatus sp. GCM10028923 TaxID=3273400 RepID=UPI00361EE849